jgi:hypothetical protein
VTVRSPAPRSWRLLRAALSLIGLALLATACEQESDPLDVVPPAAPVAALIRVSAPDGAGLLTVTGEPGAVEAGATVRASNVTSAGATVSAGAGGNGAFSLQLEGELLHVVRLRALDEAGNQSTFTDIVAGAPFTLAAVSGDGQSGTVGEALPAPLVFALTDGGGEAVVGVSIVFELATGSGAFAPSTATTDGGGQVSSVLTLGTVAGPLSILPRGAALAIDEVAGMSAIALPGPAAALVWTAGDGQKDAPGETLLGALVVQVQDSYGNGVAGLALSLAASGGGSASPDAGVSDAQGRLSSAWTLGGGLGGQTLTASAAGLADAEANAEADAAPTISAVNPITPVDPGDLLAIDGDNFCAMPAYNDLRLDALPLEVVAASETHLGARVPAGTPAGTYTLGLSVGHQAAPETFAVEVIQPLGEVEDHPLVAGSVAVELALPGTASRYAMIPYNLDYWAPEETDYVYGEEGYGIDAAAFARSGRAAAADPVGDFHRRLLSYRGDAAYTGERAARAAAQALGDRESFVCLNTAFGSTTNPASYSTITATLRYTGTHTLIYVDDDTPAANLPQTNLNTLGNRFDQFDYATDVAAFGQPSDVDANGKVVILLSPVVNAMTTGDIAPAYIGGFFNAIDLDIWTNIAGTSNHGEFFYAIVPDPSGQFSPVQHPINATIESLQSIFAHEFQHMINTGQRYILQGAPNSPDEQLWLNEGLSHLAENLCGYDAQNAARVKLYLHGQAHSGISLVQGPATLAERGAAYLFCRYLADRWPGDAFTRSLIGGPAAGPANVAQATGASFAQLFKDWAAAIYLDDRDLDGDGQPDDLGAAYRFTSHNLRTDFPYAGGPAEPLSIPTLYAQDPSWSSSLAPTAMEFLHVGVAAGQQPPAGGILPLQLSGPSNGALGVLLIRVAH